MYDQSARSATATTAKTVLAIVAILSLLVSLFTIVSPAFADHEPPDGPAVIPTVQAFPGGDPICPAGSTGVRYNDPGATRFTLTFAAFPDRSLPSEGTTAACKIDVDENIYPPIP